MRYLDALWPGYCNRATHTGKREGASIKSYFGIAETCRYSAAPGTWKVVQKMKENFSGSQGILKKKKSNRVLFAEVIQ